MIWKKIKDFPNYSVSNTGLVRSNKKILRLINGFGGRPKVCLYNKKIIKPCFVSRLVAEAFIPNPLNKPYVDHIDRDVKNNNVYNLRWCTQSENLLNYNTIKYRSLMIGNNKAVDVAQQNGIPRTTFYRRIKKGWGIIEAAIMPVHKKSNQKKE